MKFFIIQVFTIFFTTFNILNVCGFVPKCSNTDWLAFKNSYDKNYSSPLEDINRRLIFCDNLRTIDAHNERFRLGEVTYSMKLNRFADWTHEEFVKWMHGDLPDEDSETMKTKSLLDELKKSKKQSV